MERVYVSCMRMRPECKEVDGRTAGSRFRSVMWDPLDSKGRGEMPAGTVSRRWMGSTQSFLSVIRTGLQGPAGGQE